MADDHAYDSEENCIWTSERTLFIEAVIREREKERECKLCETGLYSTMTEGSIQIWRNCARVRGKVSNKDT